MIVLLVILIHVCRVKSSPGNTYGNKVELRSKYDKPSKVNAVNHDGVRSMVLTAREIEVLESIALGLTTLEISDQLFISISTVETHRRNIIKKMKAKNIVNATVKALRKGVIN